MQEEKKKEKYESAVSIESEISGDRRSRPAPGAGLLGAGHHRAWQRGGRGQKVQEEKGRNESAVRIYTERD